MKKQKIKVMVLMGGPSAEHEVSLHTGEQVIKHLDTHRYEIIPAAITKKGHWIVDTTQQKSLLVAKQDVRSSSSLVARMAALHNMPAGMIDVVFNALHGTFGEDGTIQGLLDAIDIPYTGSGVLASALGMDKPRSLKIFRDSGFCVPHFIVLPAKQSMDLNKKEIQKIITQIGLPLIVKPANGGSSIGITLARNADMVLGAIKKAKKYSSEIILQTYIKGREITCGVLERKNGSVFALPPIEIKPKLGAFYDYSSKYKAKGSDHLIPPPGMLKQQIMMIQDTALRAHQVIGCSGMSRTDFILDDSGQLHILEINTLPGMTATSLLPEAAARVGIDFPHLLDCLIVSALRKRNV